MHQVPGQLKLAIFSPEVSRQPVPDAVQGAGSQRCPGLALRFLNKSSSPQGDEGEVRGDGAQGGWPWFFWAADRTSLLFLRRGVAAVLKESKQRKGEKGITILPSF